MNAPNGIAGLGDDGKIAAAQLPSYVDDVVEGYYHEGAFYSDPAHREQITPESGKVYMDAETNITYRWSGHSYAPIGSDLALGETQSTAYRGDRGKIAYDHSMTKEGNPHGTKAADIGYTDSKGLGATNLQGAMDAAAQRATDAQKSRTRRGSHHKNWAHHRRCAKPERNADLYRKRAKPDLEQL